ncbi:MAG: tyrosine-type recombinase/integrase [Chloroflexi bacterium]|nr:tyrosine-type recombinase/integrase [Chloroflexota bacterium]
MGRPLTATFVRQTTRPGTYGDGRGGFGLILRVHTTANGRVSKTWVQRVRIGGRPTHLSLGDCRRMGLAEAREAAYLNWRRLQDGEDPRIPAAPATPTLADATESVIAAKAKTWKQPEREARAWRSCLTNHAADIVHKPVGEIATADVLRAVEAVWPSNTGTKLKSRLDFTFRWCIARGYRNDNPAGEVLTAALDSKPVASTHMRALPPDQLADALAVIDASGAHPSSKLVMWFTALTATRGQEARGCRFDEIDFDAATWTVPPVRHKTSRTDTGEFRVPLSTGALEVIDTARGRAQTGGLVFPSSTGQVMASNILSRVCRDLDIGMSPHGMRSSFRDWAAESGVDREVAELCLGHVPGDNRTERAYRRSDLLEQRRPVMQAWSDYLAS